MRDDQPTRHARRSPDRMKVAGMRDELSRCPVRFARPLWLALGAVVGIASSVLLFRVARAGEESVVRARFERVAADRVAALKLALAHTEDEIGALGAFLSSPLWLTRPEACCPFLESVIPGSTGSPLPRALASGGPLR